MTACVKRDIHPLFRVKLRWYGFMVKVSLFDLPPRVGFRFETSHALRFLDSSLADDT